MSDGIYWIASYPKSGNTWMRSFIANLTNEDEGEVDINEFNTGSIASARGWAEEELGFDIGALNHDEIDRLRSVVYSQTARRAEQCEYHKIHDAYTFLPDGKPLIPSDAITGVLYILRNPLDVAISFAHHSHCSIDQAIKNMGNPDFAFGRGSQRQHKQLRQWLLTWSMHVSSWADVEGINRMVVRYEDMKLKSCQTFTAITRFLQLPDEQEKIEQALNKCDIKKLQQQEKEKGFNEKSAKTASFFRKGIVGDWQNTLTEKQVEQIITNHAEVMLRFGYLDSQGQPLVEPLEMNSQLLANSCGKDISGAKK